MKYSCRRSAIERVSSGLMAGATTTALLFTTASFQPVLPHSNNQHQSLSNDMSLRPTKFEPKADGLVQMTDECRDCRGSAVAVRNEVPLVASQSRFSAISQDAQDLAFFKQGSEEPLNPSAGHGLPKIEPIERGVAVLTDVKPVEMLPQKASSDDDEETRPISTARQTAKIVLETPSAHSDVVPVTLSVFSGSSTPMRQADLSRDTVDLEEALAPSGEPSRDTRVGDGEIYSPTVPLRAPTPDASLWVSSIKPNERKAYIDQVSNSGPNIHIAQIDVSAAPTRMVLRQGRRSIATIAFQIDEASRISVNIGQVLDIFESRFDAEQFAHLRGSQASDTFVSIDRLADAGIPISYDPVYDELVLSEEASYGTSKVGTIPDKG